MLGRTHALVCLNVSVHLVYLILGSGVSIMSADVFGANMDNSERYKTFVAIYKKKHQYTGGTDARFLTHLPSFNAHFS